VLLNKSKASKIVSSLLMCGTVTNSAVRGSFLNKPTKKLCGTDEVNVSTERSRCNVKRYNGSCTEVKLQVCTFPVMNQAKGRGEKINRSVDNTLSTMQPSFPPRPDAEGLHQS
jgi:hypothetical protein